ncbi:pentapeptide repeat-containing protein [Streptomyces sp. NRRL B-24484]|uniref:pentapeptide repeat-containing protein n=1 Tax=Streptomyces sp. NRRL B-24484 TaxID=1463833 RepID=UPI001F240CDC|nr:pentapeptide repeat-containing protein [Streptomyces sp. NRRL B-24484]
MGIAAFDEATFAGTARFDNVTFGQARFRLATFTGHAGFSRAASAGIVGFGEATFSSTAFFGGATFGGDAWFGGAAFGGHAWFGGVTFTGNAGFGEAMFRGTAGFGRTMFTGAAGFTRTTFTGHAGFGEATFTGPAEFGDARFAGDAGFARTTFTGPTCFGGAAVAGTATFSGAIFLANVPLLGPLVCGETVDVSGALFEAPVTMEVAAQHLSCARTRWKSTATLRLRYATVDLTDAVLSSPVAVTAMPAPFSTTAGKASDEGMLCGHDPDVRVVSIRGVDAAHLVLAGTDLSACLFVGTFHLDQLRLEGRCTFARTPSGIHWRHKIWPCRWARRRTVAEEHHWRALMAGNPAPPRGWQSSPHHPDPGLAPGLDDVAAIYRQLRKTFEDGKNEPGAADFYYGEMEMRRHNRAGTPAGERGLLWAYWLISGYGLRASRALACLGVAMAVTVLTLVLWGLPTNAPMPHSVGSLTGGTIALTTESPDPVLTGPMYQRLTAQRAESAARVVVNSVVFRSSGQYLTTTGTFIEMASRILEPVLLALAVLAVRSRVKR